MTILATNRTTANTADQHVSDHDELHRLHNILDGSSQPSTGGGGGGVASLGGAGVATRGGQLNTLDVDGNPRNVLDDNDGDVLLVGDLIVGGGVVVSGDQEVVGELLVVSIATMIGHTDAQGGILQNGTTLGVPSVSDLLIHLDYTTPWGVAGDDDDGTPYYDPGNVSPGEEAILLPDLTLLRVGVPQ